MEEYIILDTNKSRVKFRSNHPTVIRQGELDTELLQVQIVTDGEPTNLDGANVYLEATRSDGHAFAEPATITSANDGMVEVQVPAGLSLIAGKVELAYFSIQFEDGSIETTENMEIFVLFGVSFFTDADFYPYIEQIIQNLLTYKETAEELTETVTGLIGDSTEAQNAVNELLNNAQDILDTAESAITEAQSATSAATSATNAANSATEAATNAANAAQEAADIANSVIDSIKTDGQALTLMTTDSAEYNLYPLGVRPSDTNTVYYDSDIYFNDGTITDNCLISKTGGYCLECNNSTTVINQGSGESYVDCFSLTLANNSISQPIIFNVAVCDRSGQDKLNCGQVKLMFKQKSTTDDEVLYFVHTGNISAAICCTDEENRIWDIYIRRMGNAYDRILISNIQMGDYMRQRVTLTLVDTAVTSLPSGSLNAEIITETMNITGDAGGNASTATSLETSRTIRTNLASTSTASFDGTANITPGVTGTLPIANGGTGVTTGHIAITQSTNSTSSVTPSLGGTFTAIDSITKDSYGHVTKYNTKTVTLPTISQQYYWTIYPVDTSGYVTGFTDGEATHINLFQDGYYIRGNYSNYEDFFTISSGQFIVNTSGVYEISGQTAFLNISKTQTSIYFLIGGKSASIYTVSGVDIISTASLSPFIENFSNGDNIDVQWMTSDTSSIRVHVSNGRTWITIKYLGAL